jgi:AraC-like DNA-binding protein
MYLYALTALARSTQADWLLEPVLAGRVRQASVLAQEFLDDARRSEGSAMASDVAVLCGDLLLAQDRDEEAEECYRRALRLAINGPRGRTRVLSCRNTGFMSLYQNRFGTALACFRRVVEDDGADDGQRVEALCGMAVAHHSIGQQSAALGCLDRAAEGAANTGSKYLVMLASVVRTDLLVQQDIRAHGELADHVFWHMPVHSATRPGTQLHPLAAIDGCLAVYAEHPLIANRLGYLRCLILTTCGDTAALQRAHEHLAWLRRSDLVAGERQARMEAALVAIAVRNVELARSMLDPLSARHAEGSSQRWNFELSYCLAKICAMDGRIDDSLKHYQHYAQESMQCVRCETLDHRSGDPAKTQERAGAPKDELEMSLPAKYRRAYRYLLEHLDCEALSVHEIADEIGVTERALQLAFRTHLGMTPAEVMRRCRIERIREDLLRGDAAGATVIETAARWGIRNRSTLVSLYRKYFSETPSETLSRSGSGQGAAAFA